MRIRLALAGFAVAMMTVPANVSAQGNLEIETPAIRALKNAMQARYAELTPFYDSGAVGITRDGKVELRDPKTVPLAMRQLVQSLVAAENADRAELYREVARANGHPEWEAQVRNTFAQRWIDKARSGWWVQNSQGAWIKR